MRALTTFMLVVTTCIAAFAVNPVVENLSFTQRTDGSLAVDIRYDLSYSGVMPIQIVVDASTDGGATSNLRCTSLSGDAGSLITPGTNKHILWDFFGDNPDATGENVSIRVTAYEGGIVTDIDGNIYKTVKIGNQWWTAENLQVTKYANGEAIANLPMDDWKENETGAYTIYDNDTDNKALYGCLYNFAAVVDERQLAPAGWRVPTHDDWVELADYFGGRENAGGHLKEAGTAHWDDPNTDATNSSGFTALPGGYADANRALYDRLGANCMYWTSTSYNDNEAYQRDLYFNYTIFANRYDNKKNGLSVRLLKEGDMDGDSGSGIALPQNLKVTAPPAPTLKSPASGSTSENSLPVLEWNGVEHVASYKIQISTNSSFSNVVKEETGVSGTSYFVYGLSTNSTYYWRVAAENPAGTSSYSSSWSFTVTGALTAAPVIENIRIIPRTDGSHLVDVYYDLIYSGSETLKLRIDVGREQSWDNHDSRFCSAYSPGVGLGNVVTPGLNKHFTRGPLILLEGYSYPGPLGKSQIALNVLEVGTMTDQDGNVYNTVKIGDQWWLAENYRASSYRNGEPIPVLSAWQDADENTPGACIIRSSGNLYNFNAITENRMIAPEGWHVPTDDDWAQMLSAAHEIYSGIPNGGVVHRGIPLYRLLYECCGGCEGEGGFDDVGFHLSCDGGTFWTTTPSVSPYGDDLILTYEGWDTCESMFSGFGWSYVSLDWISSAFNLVRLVKD